MRLAAAAVMIPVVLAITWTGGLWFFLDAGHFFFLNNLFGALLDLPIQIRFDRLEGNA